MAKSDIRLTRDYWHTKNTTSELLKVHKTLAKRSNQRLVRLERAVSKITGESYSSYGAGDIAKEYLKKQARSRFRETTKQLQNSLDNTQLRHEILKDIQAMQEFLTSKSSTVSGQRAIEKARIKTFESPKKIDGEIIREPIHFASNKEFYDFLNSETFKELSKAFDSNTIVETYDQARLQGLESDEIQQALDDYRAQTNINVKGLRASLGLKEII